MNSAASLSPDAVAIITIDAADSTGDHDTREDREPMARPGRAW